jgi:hypothetical protein
MVGHTRKVERRVDLHLVTEWVLDGLALEILVGVRRIGQASPNIQASSDQLV